MRGEEGRRKAEEGRSEGEEKMKELGRTREMWKTKGVGRGGERDGWERGRDEGKSG